MTSDTGKARLYLAQRKQELREETELLERALNKKRLELTQIEEAEAHLDLIRKAIEKALVVGADRGIIEGRLRAALEGRDYDA